MELGEQPVCGSEKEMRILAGYRKIKGRAEKAAF
jgi:hypothetical protein